MSNNKNKFLKPIPAPKTRSRAHLATRRALLMQEAQPFQLKTKRKSCAVTPGYDPELLFVECERCGAPVIWEEGKTSALLRTAGIDPLEIDHYCMLLTDGCPECSPDSDPHNVKIVRFAPVYGLYPPRCGRA